MADDVTFPCESFKDAAPQLRRPFAPNAVKWKLQTKTMIVAYVDVRTVIARLNLVVPHLWETRFEPWGERVDTNKLVCHLSIDGLTRSDVGTGQGQDGPKGAYSDSLKRAAVHFGVGHSLYAMKRLYVSALPAKARPDSKGNFSDAAQEALRKGYEKWLDEGAGKHFGEALDHGEEPDAIGGAEEEAAPEQTEDANLELAAARQEADTAYKVLATSGNGVHAKVRKKITPARFRAELDAAKSPEAVAELMERVKAAAS